MLSDDLLAAAGERERRRRRQRSRIRPAPSARGSRSPPSCARASLVARCFAALKSSVITKRLAVDAAPTAAARAARTAAEPEAAQLRAKIAAVMRETEELTAALIKAASTWRASIWRRSTPATA